MRALHRVSRNSRTAFPAGGSRSARERHLTAFPRAYNVSPRLPLPPPFHPRSRSPRRAAHFCIAKCAERLRGLLDAPLSIVTVRLSNVLNESGCRGRLVENVRSWDSLMSLSRSGDGPSPFSAVLTNGSQRRGRFPTFYGGDRF